MLQSAVAWEGQGKPCQHDSYLTSHANSTLCITLYQTSHASMTLTSPCPHTPPRSDTAAAEAWVGQGQHLKRISMHGRGRSSRRLKYRSHLTVCVCLYVCAALWSGLAYKWRPAGSTAPSAVQSTTLPARHITGNQCCPMNPINAAGGAARGGGGAAPPHSHRAPAHGAAEMAAHAGRSCGSAVVTWQDSFLVQWGQRGAGAAADAAAVALPLHTVLYSWVCLGSACVLHYQS